MKLINLNIGIRINNSEKITNFLTKHNPDIICLQEVAKPLEKTVEATFRSKEIIDAKLKSQYPYQYFSPLWQAHGFSDLDFGGYIEQGNYILSKYEITNSETYFFHKSYLKTDDWTTMKFRTEDHGRALQIITIKTDSGTIRVMNIHGVWTKDKIGDERSVNQSKTILQKISEKKLPTILVGDFNLLPTSPAIKMLNQKLKNTILDTKYTYTRPLFTNKLEGGGNLIDYIFINDQIVYQKFEVINSDISDHLPMLLQFDVKE